MNDRENGQGENLTNCNCTEHFAVEDIRNCIDKAFGCTFYSGKLIDCMKESINTES